MLAGPPKSGLGRCFFRGAFRIGGCFRVRDTLQVVANFFGYIDGDRTGVGFLFGYAKSRK